MMIVSSRRQSLVFFLLAWMHRFRKLLDCFFSLLKKQLKEIRSKCLHRVTLRLLFRAVVVSEFPPRSILAHTTERDTATAL
ncbi:unknown protein [Bathycoccus prasinos]|uniref:Uncharacterized protein n=1 Tax=Bathycoccus prasinos TaxID=41875 RepID=K8EBE2_9CHLO|nr:unknown protein [Bathycoccus prasinos]CCO15171.1 unknown protein [Bathycoccus prasinos]|eukprot:XP_007514931.1 unknown protein [Bathycoccus prasinos]